MSLKTKRMATGMTQKEAAEIFGIKYRTYQNYENGVTSPDMDTAASFARYFSCTIGELFDLKEGQTAPLDSFETELISLYRNMDGSGQKTLLSIAQVLSDAFSERES